MQGAQEVRGAQEKEREKRAAETELSDGAAVVRAGEV